MHYIVYKFIFPDGFTCIGSSKNEIKTRIHDGKYGGLSRQYLLDHGYVNGASFILKTLETEIL